jgi:hypothetical protein
MTWFALLGKKLTTLSVDARIEKEQNVGTDEPDGQTAEGSKETFFGWATKSCSLAVRFW